MSTQTMTEQVKAARDGAIITAETGEEGNPDGTEVEASAEAATDEAPAEGAETPETPEEEEIKIGTKTFKSKAEAFAWAEGQEREREIEAAHTAGIREALEASRQPVIEPAPEEDLEQEFYTDPKGTLKKVRASATDDAVKIVRGEMERERHWTKFLEDHPDISREDAEMILQRNWDTLGKMTFESGRKELAKKTRSYYQEILERTKPTTELPSNKRQGMTSGSSPKKSGVTPGASEKPVDFVTQMRMMKR